MVLDSQSVLHRAADTLYNDSVYTNKNKVMTTKH